MKAIYALYFKPDQVQQAVDDLEAAGIADSQIEIVSSEPFEQYAFGQRDHETWMPWLAVTGAVIGFSAIYALMDYAQQAWPLNTGGMPILAVYPVMVPLFEMTMLGAVLATVGTLVVTARLGRGGGLYDPEVSDGKILVGVTNPSESDIPAIERSLASAQIKRIQ